VSLDLQYWPVTSIGDEACNGSVSPVAERQEPGDKLYLELQSISDYRTWITDLQEHRDACVGVSSNRLPLEAN
jgi:hypothetical protein